MHGSRAWSTYPNSYRAREIKVIAGWILTNGSGSLVGLPGAGKSNLLGFLCHRPDALAAHLPDSIDRIVMVPLDLNNLPANNLATLYRTILRSFYEYREQFEGEIKEAIGKCYLDNRDARDPFLPLSALRELLSLLKARRIRIILVLDRFDKFCRSATARMTDTLRGLRDSFKETLSYIVGMRQEAAYLPDAGSLGELHELLDMNVCWVGALDETDSRHLIATVTHSTAVPPTESDIDALRELSGGIPALLKAACHWWLMTPERPSSGWGRALLEERSFRSRLDRIWSALSLEEQRVFSETQSMNLRNVLQAANDRSNQGKSEQWPQDQAKEQVRTLDRLADKGLGQWVGQVGSARRWRSSSSLFSAYVSKIGGKSRGRIWFDGERRLLYQGRKPLENLSPMENTLLLFLIHNPRIRLTYTELIEAAWPEDVQIEGVATEALYQLVRTLRRKIETSPSQPQYIVNWRGKPEGGYQCFPEGRPN